MATPMELKSIVWQGKWGVDEFILLPNNVFRPIKDIKNHQNYRDKIKHLQSINWEATDNLPDFVKG